MIQTHKFWLTTPLIALMALLLASLSGCLGNSQPSDNDIKSMATEFYNQEYKDLFIATEVIKKNGYKQNDTHYVAEMTITGTAKQSLADYVESIMNDKSMSSIEKIASSMTLGMMKLTLPAFEAGDELQFDKNYLFIKTDNGWMLKKELTAENQTQPFSQ